MQSAAAAAFSQSVRTVSIVGAAIGGFIGLVILSVLLMEAYKLYQDTKPKSGAVWSIEGSDIEDKRQYTQQSNVKPPRITSGEFYMNYLEYGGEGSPLAQATIVASGESVSPISVEKNPKMRGVNVTALSTEDGDVWRQQQHL